MGRGPRSGRPARVRQRRHGRSFACSRRNADLITAPVGRSDRGRQRRRAEPHEGAARCRSRRACSRTTPRAWCADRDVDVIVEIIGGIEPARSLILDALKLGEARRHRQQGAARQLRPGAVRGRGRGGGRRPAVRGVGRGRHPAHPAVARDRCRGAHHARDRHRQRHHQLRAHAHDRRGLLVLEAVAEAQKLGYAEPDPTADIEGFDAAAKAAIIACDRVRRPGRCR